MTCKKIELYLPNYIYFVVYCEIQLKIIRRNDILMGKIKLSKNRWLMFFLVNKGGFEMIGYENFALAASNSLLKKSFLQNKPITPLKLQKLLFFLHKKYLQLTNKPLFEESFEAWQYGPVLPSIYNVFQPYKSNGIDDFYREGNTTYVVDSTNDEFYTALEFVWSKYSNFKPFELVNLTHLKGSAWDKSYNNPNGRLLKISNENIKNERWSFN